MKKEINIHIEIDPEIDTLNKIHENLSLAFLKALNKGLNGNPEYQEFDQRIGEISAFIMGDESAGVKLEDKDTIRSAIKK
jgi:hypothetical protein